MKRQVRRGVFETNSSSVHSITMCSESDFDRWVNGELLFDRWGDCLVEKDKVEQDEDNQYLTYDQFNDWDYIEYETYHQSYTTPNGETIVAFGYYGHD